MIKNILLILVTLSSLHASKVLSYNIYDRTDRADVMITFDTPYEGVIKQSIGKNKIKIKLMGASIESSKIKKISSKFLHSITITPMASQIQIVASVPYGIKLLVSKTSDAYGLRLRFTNKGATQSSTKQTQTSPSQSNSISSLPTKSNSEVSTSYYIVVTTLIIGIIILFIIKKRILTKGTKIDSNKSTWLFKENSSTKKEVTPKEVFNNNPISIRFQKSINEDNSVVMLEFGAQSYLVIIGKSNLLLDKFTDNKPTTQEDFESILYSRNEELEQFLNQDPSTQQQNSFNISSNDSMDALKAYKERAASMAYDT